MTDNHLLQTARTEVFNRARERWFKWMVAGKNKKPASGFFDAYPRFFSTSQTHPERNRLNLRFRALVEANLNAIRGKRVLDLASHDGRWSIAASKAGADYVLGIEAREHFIREAKLSAKEYETGNVEFLEGDMFKILDSLPPRFDTVFCFGFFYHTADHMTLLRKIAALNPTYLIIDTAVSNRCGNIVEIRDEIVAHEGSGAVGELGDTEKTLIGWPTKGAINSMLRAAGFGQMRYFDWHHAGIEQWDDVAAYYMGKRVTVTASRKKT